MIGLPRLSWEDRWLARPALVLFLIAFTLLAIEVLVVVAYWLAFVAFVLMFVWSVASLATLQRMRREMAEARKRWATPPGD